MTSFSVDLKIGHYCILIRKKWISYLGQQSLSMWRGTKKELAKPNSKIDLYLCKTHEVDRGELNRLKYELGKPFDDNIGVHFDPDDDLDQYLTSVFSKPLEPLPTTETELKISYITDELNLPAVTESNQPAVTESNPPAVIGLDPQVAGTSSGGNIGVSCGLYPVCNKREKHRDDCLRKRETSVLYSFIESDDESYEKRQEIEDDKIIDFRKDIQFVIKQCDFSNTEVHINIRRENEFEDFKKFFGKSWNRKKLTKTYKISFVGEPAIDIGGVSREFYSGLSIYLFYL